MNELATPTLDPEVIKKASEEAALKGALECIKEYYTGYKSPYKEALDKHLKEQQISMHFQLPDVIAHINAQLSAEATKIANTAVAKTFIPLLQRFITKVEKQIKFSDLLKEFIESLLLPEYHHCSLSIEREPDHGWLNIDISYGEDYQKREYKICLHKDYEAEKEGKERYRLLSLPYGFEANSYRQSMKISLEGASLEIPFTPTVLQDAFVSYCARLIMCETIIEMDVWEFDEEMFPNNCHCD